MFDFGFWELLVIGVIALLVVGPERLPSLMRTTGLWVGRARAAMASIRDEVEREVNAQGLRDTRRAVEENVRKAVDESGKPLREAADSVRADVDAAARQGEADGGRSESATADGAQQGGDDTPAGARAGGEAVKENARSSTKGAGATKRTGTNKSASAANAKSRSKAAKPKSTAKPEKPAGEPRGQSAKGRATAATRSEVGNTPRKRSARGASRAAASEGEDTGSRQGS